MRPVLRHRVLQKSGTGLTWPLQLHTRAYVSRGTFPFFNPKISIYHSYNIPGSFQCPPSPSKHGDPGESINLGSSWRLIAFFQGPRGKEAFTSGKTGIKSHMCLIPLLHKKFTCRPSSAMHGSSQENQTPFRCRKVRNQAMHASMAQTTGVQCNSTARHSGQAG
jgi:hypothetical protein